ncbi:hypothetical protein BKA70DRAFT_542602 [Coprinopsis sp. MPI-PUGE-AT-0042]|nr:hypothetical protein BKA70DRAFT_542602 [Coprinopsis sp. MPI-PUGE-AT-0042]
MGTLPFLAVDMAREPEKPLQRLLFHDLEAVLWCMVWYCQEQQKWRKGTFTDICAQKSLWTRHVDPLEPPSDIRKGTRRLYGEPSFLLCKSGRKADEMTSRKPMIDQDWMDSFASN